MAPTTSGSANTPSKKAHKRPMQSSASPDIPVRPKDMQDAREDGHKGEKEAGDKEVDHEGNQHSSDTAENTRDGSNGVLQHHVNQCAVSCSLRLSRTAAWFLQHHHDSLKEAEDIEAQAAAQAAVFRRIAQSSLKSAEDLMREAARLRGESVENHTSSHQEN